MGNWSQWIHYLGQQHQGYQCQVIQWKGWCRLFPYSDMFFMFPFEISSVSRIIPDDRKCASGAMMEASETEVAVTVGAVLAEIAA